MDIEKDKKVDTDIDRKNSPNPSWGHIDSDLKEALNTWAELTEELANKMSPEEKQLQEIKGLLGTIKDKLKEFNEDV